MVDDGFVAAEGIQNWLLVLISLIVFLNVVSGSNFVSSMMRFILSRSKFLTKDVIYDRFMTAEKIIFGWLYLILIIVLSNVGLGFNFSSSNMLFILRISKWFPDDVLNIVIQHCDVILTYILLITSVASEKHGIFELIVTSSYSIYFNSWCCCYITSKNVSSGCSKFGLIYKNWPGVLS